MKTQITFDGKDFGTRKAFNVRSTNRGITFDLESKKQLKSILLNSKHNDMLVQAANIPILFTNSEWTCVLSALDEYRKKCTISDAKTALELHSVIQRRVAECDQRAFELQENLVLG